MANAALRVATVLGAFTIELHEPQAPATCAYFRRLAACGALDGGGVFRITTTADDSVGAIAVVQFGTSRALDEPRARIPHESTATTGLTHRRWTASAARMAPGEVYGSVFVCMRDEPSLDAGGSRNADGYGFAAFGRVVDGHAVLEFIFAQARAVELLPEPIGIARVTVVEPHRAVLR